MKLEQRINDCIKNAPVGSQHRLFLRQILGEFKAGRHRDEQAFLNSSLKANSSIKGDGIEQERVRLESKILIELGAK